MQLACLSAASKRGNVIMFLSKPSFLAQCSSTFWEILWCAKGRMMYVGGGFQRKVVGGDVNALWNNDFSLESLIELLL